MTRGRALGLKSPLGSLLRKSGRGLVSRLTHRTNEEATRRGGLGRSSYWRFGPAPAFYVVRSRTVFCCPATPRLKKAMVSGRRSHPTAALPARMAPATKIIPISACATWTVTAPIMNDAKPRPAGPRRTGISHPDGTSYFQGTGNRNKPSRYAPSCELIGPFRRVQSTNLPAPNITNTTAKTMAPATSRIPLFFRSFVTSQSN